MITANRARELYNEDEVYKNTLKYLNDQIQKAAKEGKTSVHTYVYSNAVMRKLVTELSDLGYAVITEQSGYISVSF